MNKNRRLVWPDYLPGGRRGTVTFDLYPIHLLHPEINRWVDSKDLALVLMYRGAFIAAWPNIETIETELCIRASRLARYARLKSQYPYSRQAKAKFLRNVGSAEGPLKPLAPWINLMLERLDRFGSFRDMMVHSRMGLPSIKQGTKFDHWDMVKSEGLTHFLTPASFEEIQSKTERICRLSRWVTRAYAQYITEDVLPR
ncbi:hypothetical protein HFP57_06205 [Parasphingopyxis algicola]|uniref:hypothetical protein n=1 Tax=Parasphingopyxis algicola TaxID=2026624 RepID=UPI0015A19A1B|nr:hypothetical protein [Parasphingopyxis algicola]QLC24664.1 hypothetical protein HFP57_06205 [Parasphingopyxis algicola]